MAAKDRFAIVGILALIATGCGGASGHPDTGAGAHQPVPATENCADVCKRFGDCLVVLCNEDTQSTRFQGAGEVLAEDCLSTCADDTVMSKIAPTQWTCFFDSSCRQIFEYHRCDPNSYYRCS